MRKLLMLLTIAMLLISAALAEFDTEPLRLDEDHFVFTDEGTLDTVYRPVHQPYLGQLDETWEGDLIAYAEFVTLVNEGVTVPRLLICTVAYDMPLRADQAAVMVGKTKYIFPVSAVEAEYDGQYLEDHAICLAGEGLEMLRAIARQKTDAPVAVELISLGEIVFSGQVIISGDDAAELYDRFVDLGGRQQNLRAVEERWPCTVEKVKGE